jgi:hypothetical protein
VTAIHTAACSTASGKSPHEDVYLDGMRDERPLWVARSDKDLAGAAGGKEGPDVADILRIVENRQPAIAWRRVGTHIQLQSLCQRRE